MIRIFFLFFFLPILLYSSEQETLKIANALKLYEKNEWKALLHYNNQFNIKNNFFLLSSNISLKNELIATIHGFYNSSSMYINSNNHPQCKFPARLIFILHELNISKDEFPKINCYNLNIYRQKAPSDNIFLVYASENVKNPSSMMGHTFLKFKGVNFEGKNVEHAITFYTIIESFNLFRLLYQNTISGMKGIFALQPYKKVLQNYTKKENRNVWEYQLNLTEYRKQLIYYHVWELKDIEMRYFLTSYNCATVLYYILSLANPVIYTDKKLWVTPLDIVKFLYRYNLIKNSYLLPSNEWLVKMLEEKVKETDIITEIVEKSAYSKIANLDFYSLELLNAYSNLKYNNKSISLKEKNNITKHLHKIQSFNKNIFDISRYKSPKNIPNERQFVTGYTYRDEKQYLKLSFLPASHLINDNNIEYFGESELKVAYLSLLINNENIKLEEFTLYGMKSYMPYSRLTNDLSYQFEFAIKKEYAADMENTNTLKIDGGAGVDFMIKHDVNIFGLLNAGVGYNIRDKLHVFFNPQIGMMIYEVFNMKSSIYYQPLFINHRHIYNKYVVEHNIFLHKNHTFYINFESVNSFKNFQNYEFGMKFLF